MTDTRTPNSRRRSLGAVTRRAAVLFPLALVGSVLPLVPAGASSATFVVNSVGDGADAGSSRNGICAAADGTCTLRAAIMEANAVVGPAVISFDIPGSGVQTIKPATALPTLQNADGITIDGYTQPGSAPNTAQLGSNAVLRVQMVGPGPSSFAGLRMTAPDNTVRGLSIHGFRQSIFVTGTSAHRNRLVGNFICTDPAGVVGAGSINGGAAGILVQSGPDENVIGAPTLADRNVISGCAHRGVIIANAGTRYNKVQNNVVGLNPSGTAALPNRSHGLDVNFAAQDNLFGGTGALEGNVVSGNGQSGIEISHGTYNRRNNVIGNFVGTDLSGTKLLSYTGNRDTGIRLEGEKRCEPCSPNAGYSKVFGNIVVGNGGGMLIDKGQQRNQVYNNWIGVFPDGTAAGNRKYGIRIEQGAIYNRIGPGNVIAHNEKGVQMQPTASQPPSDYVLATPFNTLTRNSMYANGKLGTDLIPYNQVNINGVGSADVQENVQAPKISSASAATVAGTTCASCVIEVFIADATSISSTYTLDNYGEGKRYVGTTTADSSGKYSLTPPAGSLASGDIITANTRTPNGSTSEFSKNVRVG